MAVNSSGLFEDYWSQRKKKLRDNVKRYFKRAAQDGFEESLRESRTPSDVERAFETYARIESSGWKGEAGTAITIENAQGRFYGDVLRRFAARGQARIFELLFNDEVVSSRIGIQDGNMIVFLKTTYDERFSKYSPGRRILYRTLETLFADDSADELEFYTNATADQAQWASELREIQHVTMYRSAAVCALFGILRKARAVLRRSDK